MSNIVKNKSVFRRNETKFRVNREQKAAIMAAIGNRMREDEHGHSTILSLYFDTPDYRMIRRSIEHPEYKEKIRARSYGLVGEKDDVFLELKKKYRKIVYKRRMDIKAGELPYLMKKDKNGIGYLELRRSAGWTKGYRNEQISKEMEYARDFYETLEPRMLISYEREAWFDREDPELRITFDKNILWRTEKLDLSSGIYGESLIKNNEFIMEIKSSDGIPIWLTEILNEFRAYKTSFSKYGGAYMKLKEREKAKLYEAALLAGLADAAYMAERNLRNQRRRIY